MVYFAPKNHGYGNIHLLWGGITVEKVSKSVWAGGPPQLGQCNAIRANPMKKDIYNDIKITWPGEYLTIVSVFSSLFYLSTMSVNFWGGFEGVQFVFR